MTSPRRFIPPLALVLIGGAAIASIFAWLTVERLATKGRHKAALESWEDEGGSIATTDVAAH